MHGARPTAVMGELAMELFSAIQYTRFPLILLTHDFEVTTMGKGNNARSKEKKKPKKAAAPKPISVKATLRPRSRDGGCACPTTLTRGWLESHPG